MNKEVYKHLLRTYGRNVGQWVGLLTHIFRILTNRVYIVIAMANITSSIASGDLGGAKKHTLYFLLAYIFASVIGTLGELLSTHTENKQYHKLMMVFYQKLVGKDLAFYRDNQTGYLASIFRQYLDGTMVLLRFLRGEAMGTVLSLVLPPIVLYFASPKVGLAAAGIIFIQLIYVMWSSAKANKYRHLSHEIYRKVTGEVSDEITNIIAFKSGGMVDKARSRMKELSKIENEAYQLRRRTTTLLDFPRNVLTGLGTTTVIYLIITSGSVSDPKSLGLIVLTLTYMFMMVRSVGALPELVTTHDDLITKIAPTLKYFSNDYEDIKDIENPKELVVTSAAISIENVVFSYPSHSKDGSRIPVFSDLNFEIKGGEKVGVVGLSGAGKSTLANLLLRFDEVDSGAIKIDGINIKDVRQDDLRRQIAYVPQEPLLFHRTIRDNIAYFNADADEREIVRAAEAAHAHEFIDKLPDGYDTMVGERGIKLSGGQKQRVVIARAILKKAPIMIFDEATSALDSESEQIIQRALPEIIGKQTALVVAHRLSTIAGLDRIIVMHEGQIVEHGTHDELLAQKGRYYSLWQKQTTEFSQ